MGSSKNKKLLMAGGALILVYLLMRSGLPGRLFEGLGTGPSEERKKEDENPYAYPDYSSWTDRNKVLLDPGVSGGQSEIGISTTPTTPITPVEGPQTPGYIPPEPYSTPQTSPLHPEGGAGPELPSLPGFPSLDDLINIGIAGLIGYDIAKRVKGRFRRPPSPPPGKIAKLERLPGEYERPVSIPKPTPQVYTRPEPSPTVKTRIFGGGDIKPAPAPHPQPGPLELGALAAGAAGAAAVLSKVVTGGTGRIMRLISRVPVPGAVIPPGPQIFKPALERLGVKFLEKGRVVV